MTVVETPGFLRDAATAMAESERDEVVSFLAANPDAGDVMPDTGGARKLRWRAPGRGKRGGFRVIYYYHNEAIPLFLLNVFAKNEKIDLSAEERSTLRKILSRLVDAYRGRREEK